MSIHHILRIDRANKSFPIAMIAVWNLLSSTLQGQEALIISLHSVEDRISKQNPDLAAARKYIDEATGRLRQSGHMSNPVLGLEVSQNPDFLEYSYSVSIAQKFPVTNRLALAKNFSEKSLRAAEAEVWDIERRLCSSAKELVIRILAIEKQRELLSQQKSLANDFASHLHESAQKGEGSVLDAGQAKIKAAQLANELHQLEARAATLLGELKPLLGMAAGDPLIISGDLPHFIMPAKSSQLGQRPDLIAAKLRASAAATSADLERAKSREDIELTLSAGANRSEDAPLGYDTEQHIGIGIRIPLPFRDRNQGGIDEADARSIRRQLEVAALEHHIRHQAETAYEQMIRWAKIGEEISEDLLPLAREQSQLALRAYHEGQGNIQSTLLAREQVLKLASSRLEALRDFHLAKARYQSALNQ